MLRARKVPVARPREFDEKEVLDRALDTFWEKGFDGTSIADLVEATGVARASLYGAFGDKQQLYERVLDHYRARVDDVVANLDESLSSREALRKLLRGWVESTCPKQGQRGCFLLLAGTQGGDAPFAREALAEGLVRMEKHLTELVRRGQERGELDPSRDAASIARLLIVVVQGIAATARAGWSVARLRAVVDEVLAGVVPP
jgi:TetR/AcrR family transcriptional repressor of nem operon